MEIYHRKTGENFYIDEAGYKEIRKALINAIPAGTADEHRSALAGRIGYMNEKSLRSRIKELLGELDPETVKKFCGTIKEFSESLSALRDEFTHGKKEDGQTGDVRKNLHRYSLILSALLTLLLLKRSGVSEAMAVKAIESRYPYLVLR